MEDNFSLGSVQYSVLEPGIFTKLPENKDKWVLMNGQNIHGSDLQNLIPTMESVPDARGLFIRSMNLGRGSDIGDGDGDHRGQAGLFQSDAFKGHTHGYTHFDGGVVTDFSNDKDQRRASYGSMVGDQTEPVGGNETRPRNIALYLYMKINN